MDNRRASTIRFTVDQLLWLGEQAVRRRKSQQAIVEESIVRAGAPAEWSITFVGSAEIGEDQRLIAAVRALSAARTGLKLDDPRMVTADDLDRARALLELLDSYSGAPLQSQA